jgi:hypothetical protein
VGAYRAAVTATITTGDNRNDVVQLIPLIEAISPIRGKRGQPLRRPRHLHADRGYDHDVYRSARPHGASLLSVPGAIMVP